MIIHRVPQLEPFEDLLHQKRYHVRVEDVLDPNAEAQRCLLKKPLQVRQLDLFGEELVLVLPQVVLVVALRLALVKLIESLEDSIPVLRDDLLLAHTIMTHLEQDQLAVEEKHLASSVVFFFAIASQAFFLAEWYLHFGVLIIRFDGVLDDFEVVEPFDEVLILRLGQQVDGSSRLHHQLDMLRLEI